MDTTLGVNTEKLTGLINAVKDNSNVGKTVWKADTHWEDGFRSQALIPKPSGGVHTVEMDEPNGLGGTETAPNMVEMVLGAYGCCLTTGLVANAALRGIELKGVDISLEGDLDLRGFLGLSSEVRSGYSEIRLNVKLDAPTASEGQLKELYDAVMTTSPVGDIICNPVTVKAQLA